MKLAFAVLAMFFGVTLTHFAQAEQTSEKVRDLDNRIQALEQEIGALKANANAESPPPSKQETGIHYKGVTIQLGGFLASETVYRSNNTASDIATSYGKIPFGNSPGYGVSEFRGTERQSRFSLLASGDVNSTTHLAGYYELDFLGTSPTSNANQSNSYTPRTRHVYGTVDWDEWGLHILAGQNWSLVTLNTKGITPRNEYIPATIDAQYAVGFNWERQWQMRIVKDWQKKFWLALSLENAQTVENGSAVAGVNNPGTGNTFQLPAGALMSSAMSLNSYPDVIAKFAYESEFGHFEIYNLARNFQSRYGGTSSATQGNTQSIWTDSVGAGATVPVIGKRLDVSISGLYGKGAGRYGTVQLPDATYDADGSLSPLLATQYLAQVAWHATNRWDFYAAFGQEKVDDNTGGGGTYGYGDGLTLANPNTGCSNLGSCSALDKMVTQTNVGFWWSFYKGDYGAAKLGAQYSHTQLDTFADATGVAPSTTEDMIFTSLRYFPF